MIWSINVEIYGMGENIKKFFRWNHVLEHEIGIMAGIKDIFRFPYHKF